MNFSLVLFFSCVLTTFASGPAVSNPPLSFTPPRIKHRFHRYALKTNPKQTFRRDKTILRDAGESRVDTAPEQAAFLRADAASTPPSPFSSHISTIRSYNLAGVVSENTDDNHIISVNLADHPNLVSVTGESGSGKSLLVARVAELVCGGKATAAFSPKGSNDQEDVQAFVEMVLKLGEPHLSMVERSLQSLGLNSAISLRPREVLSSQHELATITLRRVFQSSSKRLKSQCEINGQPVTLKALRTVASPLVAVVDASAAAFALSRPNSRLAIIDTGVPSEVLSLAKATKSRYRTCREYRERLEQELASRILPPSMLSGDMDDEKDLELLRHWVDELDAFEGRVTRFCETISDQQLPSGSSISRASENVCSQAWSEDYSSNTNDKAFSSSLYARLVDFREAVRTLDAQLSAAQSAYDALSSLSAPDSAVTAVERARNFLFDATGKETGDSPLLSSAETTHDRLNRVEEALAACARALEDDRKGFLSLLGNIRSDVAVSMEDIDTLIADWNTLARKHGIVPYVLPSCHRSLKGELDGNVEARTKLPKAMAEEAEALEQFEEACAMLTTARRKVAQQLSTSVTKRLPSLGMERSTFEAALQGDVCSCTDGSAYGIGATLGVDELDFLLLHEGKETASSPSRGGKVDIVASSGEKARILLAIECELPGSIGASRWAAQESSDGLDTDSISTLPPVAVIYDEIDAHVGGRAAVAMASMLADQTRPRKDGGARSQIISITHSPSVAAIADKHLVIERSGRDDKNGRFLVRASMVEQQERQRELARMASGDLAHDEAQIFAAALLRDGARQQEKQDVDP